MKEKDEFSKKIRKMDMMFRCGCGVFTDKYVNIAEVLHNTAIEEERQRFMKLLDEMEAKISYQILIADDDREKVNTWFDEIRKSVVEDKTLYE